MNVPSREQLQRLTVVQLKDLLRGKNLPVSGIKEVLINRYLQSFQPLVPASQPIPEMASLTLQEPFVPLYKMVSKNDTLDQRLPKLNSQYLRAYAKYYGVSPDGPKQEVISQILLADLSRDIQAAQNIMNGQPPEFSPPRPSYLFCEGHWDLEPGQYSPAGDYLPVSSKYQWPDKKEWLAAAYKVNKWMKDHKFYSQMRGYAPSRLTGEHVGSGSYQEPNMCWPENYIGHYIEDNNVMPTQKFYTYIITKAAQLK